MKGVGGGGKEIKEHLDVGFEAEALDVGKVTRVLIKGGETRCRVSKGSVVQERGLVY